MGLEGSFSKDDWVFFLGQSVPTTEAERPEERVAKIPKFPSWAPEAGVERLDGPGSLFWGVFCRLHSRSPLNDASSSPLKQIRSILFIAEKENITLVPTCNFFS